jgi:hypothetical protein
MSLLNKLGTRVCAALFLCVLFAAGAPQAMAQAPSGVPCASEDGYCNFSGTQFVRYGAGDRFVVRLLTDGTACTNAVFGDPIFGVRKACTIETAVFPTQRCANEDGRCRFADTRYVFYGAGDRYAARAMAGGADCNNSVFGDPAPGARKACYLGAVAPARALVQCANEDGHCQFSGTRYVYYGAGDSFAVRALTNGASCSNAVFGDPAPNVRKVCYVSR